MCTGWASAFSKPSSQSVHMPVSESAILAVCAVSGVCAQADAPLAALTTIHTGGRAAALVTVSDVTAAVAVLKVLQEHDVPLCCLGAGSDLLVADDGYSGVVVRLGVGFQQVEGLTATNAARGSVAVGAGCQVPKFATLVAEAGLAGLEFACGIPGSVGGGVATNAGAYGRAFSDVLTEVQLATAEGARWLPVGELDWEYRHCRLPERALVTAARFKLERDEPAAILDRHRSILEMRRAVQPQGVLTFGSTFKNPSGGAAGRLLDAAGLKGERRGGAEVSTVHANFVVNLGEASTADVLTLMNHMRRRVHETSGVSLEPEVRLLGTSFPWESTADGVRRSPSAHG
jgi:UDP-N-acetylenolpyruvoylglucosamine reductase